VAISPLYHRLSATLLRYLSPVTTETVMRRALRDAGLSPDTLDVPTMDRMSPHLERGIKLFVPHERQERLRAELAMLTHNALDLPEMRTISVRLEEDISEARMAARAICAETGARPLATQKVTTIVSELARNIVSYTSGGSVELRVLSLTPGRLRIRAVDAGTGIPDLDQILSGRYKSKTGLGKGLLGIKRLAEAFSVQTGATGTRVEVEVTL
jgi:serine/threonine-protein kinase RsbT